MACIIGGAESTKILSVPDHKCMHIIHIDLVCMHTAVSSSINWKPYYITEPRRGSYMASNVIN